MTAVTARREIHWALGELHSQVVVRRKGDFLGFKPGTPPLGRCRSLGILHVDHVAQLLLLGWLEAMKYFINENELLFAKRETQFK